jgi:cation-transporting ATPase E
LEITGLTQYEVKERISRGETNSFTKSRTKTVSEILIENIFSLFNFIVIGILAFVLFYYFKTNDTRLLLDCIGISSVAVLNLVIAIFQEIKAKRALDKVNLLLIKTVTVVREGITFEINQSEIVKDDVIKAERGDQIVVDGKVIQSSHLELDESLLTGESIPIEKEAGAKVLSGSFCVSGTGYYKAEKVGQESYANNITHLAKKYKFVLTPLQKKLNIFLKMLFAFALVLVALKLIFNEHQQMPEVDFIREIATILSSLIPQGLILTSSISYAIGVVRISKIGAIIQKLNAIESFSNVKVVCMDKTGTLTQNKLSVSRVSLIDETIDSDSLNRLIGTYAHLIQSKNSTSNALEIFKGYDNYVLINEMPFSSENKFSLAEISDGTGTSVYILGAYDVLSEKLAHDVKAHTEEVYSQNNIVNYRNLIFGKITGKLTIDEIKENNNRISFNPLGIFSISDTVRDNVLSVLELFKRNNIDFKILSGDSSEAIASIIDDIGWRISIDKYITGSELDKLSKDEFELAVKEKEVFSRLKPEHKLKIIKVLKSKKIFTAMVGDGVNDLPAIKEADMGIAMEEGSAVTKETADIVLLKNKFSLLPEIFNEGNKIVNSVNLVSKLFLTKNFTVILFTLLSYFSLMLPLFDYPITPRRVSLINIFAIGLPSIIISFKNRNTERSTNFLKDILTYVLMSSFIIVFCSYMSRYIVVYRLGSSIDAGAMVAISIVIILSISNFLVVSKYTHQKQFTFYLYSFALLLLFVIVAVTDVNILLFRFIRKFYEIESFKIVYWITIIFVSILGSILLYQVNKLRDKFLNGRQ